MTTRPFGLRAVFALTLFLGITGSACTSSKGEEAGSGGSGGMDLDAGGAANQGDRLTTKASPSPDRVFQRPVLITLTPDRPAATHYTLDGSEVTDSSPLYTAPISISQTTVIKFFSVGSDGMREAAQSHTYKIDNVRVLLLQASSM